MSQEETRTSKLEEQLGKYLFQEQYKKGYSFNAYGDEETIEAIVKRYLDEKFPTDPTQEKREEIQGTQVLCEIYLQEEWAAITDVYQRFWMVWRPVLQKLSRLVLDRMESGEVETLTEIKDNMKNVADFFAQDDLAQIASDHSEAMSKWTILRTELKGMGIQAMFILHDFDKVSQIFPSTEAVSGMFFRELFRLTTKSHKGNREKILLISREKCSSYEHHNPGSSLAAAYAPLVYVREEES